MELLKLTRSVLELNKKCFDAEINPEDKKFEDETEIHEALRHVGESYYELHHAVFELIAWNSHRRNARLNPRLYLIRHKKVAQTENLDEVLKRLGL